MQGLFIKSAYERSDDEEPKIVDKRYFFRSFLFVHIEFTVNSLLRILKKLYIGRFFVTIEYVMFMKAVGIICEYNPFHNGHLYHIEKVKEMYPDAVIVLVLGGYFLERGEVSVMSKWNKTGLALKYGVDLVVELPVLYGTNAGDYFAYYALKILNECKIDVLVFGSECDDVDLLTNVAQLQSDVQFNEKVKEELKKGTNYPSSLAGVLEVKLESNDLLGVSYIKAIQAINPNIEARTIKRTNKFNDIESDEFIVSAQNIRKKLLDGTPIDGYVPNYDLSLVNEVDMDKMFEYLRFRIITEKNLEKYLGVDEGLENKLKSSINDVDSYEKLLDAIKSKRYTTSRLRRMLIHVLLGIEKSDMEAEYEQYRILGFNSKGKAYLKTIDSEKLVFKCEHRAHEVEMVASSIYRELTSDVSTDWEILNKPIIKD